MYRNRVHRKKKKKLGIVGAGGHLWFLNISDHSIDFM